ncbi:general substrate transporter [Dipodascopsis tothii]|uniref:general substrate transporter n=1 Tax=Dipodascopsis tothii TaxID=44089 RepID=UPI0034CF011A
MKNPIEKLSGVPLMILLTMCNAMSMAWFGYDQGVFSGVLISEDFIDHFPQVKNSNISGITSSCFSLGAFVGCILAFRYGDKFGRRKTIFVGQVLNLIGAVLQVTSFQFPQLIIGRVINGMGMGITSSTCPVYQAECSKASIRGKLVVVGSLSNTAAYCLANWMNYGLYFRSGPLQWRFPLAFQLIFPIVVIPLVLCVPESPRWLLMQDRSDEALKVLSRLFGRNLPVSDPEVIAEHRSILKTIEEERESFVPVKDVLRCRDSNQNLRRVILSCGTQFMQQFTGVNALGYYLPTLLTEFIGFSTEMAKLLAAINATSYLGAAFLCLLLIDVVGRRRLMMWGSLSAGSCYLVAAICMKVSETRLKRDMGIVTTSMFFLYYVCYGTSFAKVPWVYNSEINSIGWRTRGAAAATATNWMGGFIITQFTKTGVVHLRWKFYLMFTIFLWVFFPVVYFLYPETCNRTLEDIDLVFLQHKGLIVTDKALTQRKRPQEFIEAEKQRIEAGERIMRESQYDDVYELKSKNASAASHLESA